MMTETVNRLLDALRSHNYSFATAESCTGGNIAHSVTLVPGCSDVMAGGVVSYSNAVKTRLLGVDPATLTAHGAVSEPVVRQMAEGVRKATGADVSVATSGIAGPGGAVPGKPVGTVWFAVSTPEGTDAFVRHIPGDRHEVIESATLIALSAVINRLEA